VLRLKNGAPRFSCFGRKVFLPVEPPPQADLSFLFLLGRTQVRLIPLLYQVSGHCQIYFRPRGGLGKRKSTVCGLNGCLPRLIYPRGTCHLNPRPVSFLAALALSRPSSAGRSANASLSARKICPAYFFDRNRTSKKLRQLPKPRLSAAAHRTN
jgi:hypothetical protein